MWVQNTATETNLSIERKSVQLSAKLAHSISLRVLSSVAISALEREYRIIKCIWVQNSSIFHVEILNLCPRRKWAQMFALIRAQSFSGAWGQLSGNPLKLNANKRNLVLFELNCAKNVNSVLLLCFALRCFVFCLALFLPSSILISTSITLISTLSAQLH